MGNEIKYLETKTEKIPYCCSLNVIEQMQTEYGSLQAWSELIEPKDNSEPNIKALKFFLTEAINEGIDIENEEKHENRPFFSERKVGRLITEIGLGNIGKQVRNAVVESYGKDEQSDGSLNTEESKNVNPAQNQ